MVAANGVSAKDKVNIPLNQFGETEKEVPGGDMAYNLISECKEESKLIVERQVSGMHGDFQNTCNFPTNVTWALMLRTENGIKLILARIK